ncbi:phage tail protein [Brenneria sp. 4F2]|nr:phage tail protein [Brenneria bubanii]
MTLLSSRSAINTVMSILYGHQDFISRNTGLTQDAHKEHYIQNPDGVLSNNRHFIADTMAEYQPNGDGTTEGQSLHIIGYCHLYLATRDPQFLTAAIRAWNAYINYFYAGQTIPDSPQRFVCNWIVNSKEPVLANYPINPDIPTQGGFKSVPLVFTNGQTKIPHGAPFWGEYLDVATFAHRGHMMWDAINGSVQQITENVEGLIDWQTVYDSHRNTTSVNEPWNSLAWIDWQGYLGAPYTVAWDSSSNQATEYAVSWLNVWTNNKIGVGKGADGQQWSGDIIAGGIANDDIGTVQLEDSTLNGVYLLNYAVRLPVNHGGYLFSRNEPWHNRPVHTPLPKAVSQMGNAADAEVWFIDACYLLWRITGETRYKKALDCVFFTAHEYTYIDASDKFFRQSTSANTPFTDGVSYDFSSPSGAVIEYGRDEEGYITIASAAASQHFLEQQSVWFRAGQDSKLRVTYGGVGVSGALLGCRAMLNISATKQAVSNPVWYGLALPKSSSMSPVVQDIHITSLALMTNPETKEDYLVADGKAVTDYGGCTWTEAFEAEVYDGRDATIINATFPNDDAGFIIGFWLTEAGAAAPVSIVYRADADFNMRLTDENQWRWWWMLPATNGKWSTAVFEKSAATLSSYQPHHKSSEAKPTSPVYATVSQLSILLDASTTNSHFSYYVVNEVPPLFSLDNGWTMTYRMALSCSEAWHAAIGDCTIIDYRLDSLAYCPGVIPFSNIYSQGSDQIGAWHGMPYPGYQYPLMYCLHSDATKYATWLSNQIDFLYDSQVAYQQQVGTLGPGCAAYIWNRWDNYKYGAADTWTTYHWGDGKPWSGYQPRAFNAAARAWYELKVRGQTVPERLELYVTRWINWLMTFSKENGGQTPDDFPVAPNPPLYTGFTGHMTGLWLAGSCFALLAGCDVDGLEQYIDVCVKGLADNFTVTTVPGKNINGAWSPAARVASDNGMAFGFYSGEIFRGLGLYLTYKQHGAGYDIYSATAIPDHATASVSQ